MPVSSPYALFRAVDLDWPPCPRPLSTAGPLQAGPRTSDPTVPSPYDESKAASSP